MIKYRGHTQNVTLYSKHFNVTQAELLLLRPRKNKSQSQLTLAQTVRDIVLRVFSSEVISDAERFASSFLAHCLVYIFHFLHDSKNMQQKLFLNTIKMKKK